MIMSLVFLSRIKNGTFSQINLISQFFLNKFIYTVSVTMKFLLVSSLLIISTQIFALDLPEKKCLTLDFNIVTQKECQSVCRMMLADNGNCKGRFCECYSFVPYEE